MSLMVLLALLPFSYLFQLMIMSLHTTTCASKPIDLTKGFISLPLNRSNLVVQKPYDVPENHRYSFTNGVHKLWVYSTDKPHSLASKTNPRTEIRIQASTGRPTDPTHGFVELPLNTSNFHIQKPYDLQGYDYSSGVWQFEAYGYVPCGASSVCVMQVFGSSPPHATTLMLRVYHMAPVLVPNIYDTWFRLNIIHDVEASNVKVYIDGILKYEAPGRGGKSHYFKCGVFAQNHDGSNSYYMESRWKGIKVLKK